MTRSRRCVASSSPSTASPSTLMFRRAPSAARLSRCLRRRDCSAGRMIPVEASRICQWTSFIDGSGASVESRPTARRPRWSRTPRAWRLDDAAAERSVAAARPGSEMRITSSVRAIVTGSPAGSLSSRVRRRRLAFSRRVRWPSASDIQRAARATARSTTASASGRGAGRSAAVMSTGAIVVLPLAGLNAGGPVGRILSVRGIARTAPPVGPDDPTGPRQRRRRTSRPGRRWPRASAGARAPSAVSGGSPRAAR